MMRFMKWLLSDVLRKFQQRAAADRVTRGNLMFEVWAHCFIFLILLLCPHTFGHIVSVSCPSVLVNPLQQVLGLYLAQWHEQHEMKPHTHTHTHTYTVTHALHLEVTADCDDVVLETFCLYKALDGWINSPCSEGLHLQQGWSTQTLTHMFLDWLSVHAVFVRWFIWSLVLTWCFLVFCTSVGATVCVCVCVCVCVDLQNPGGR